MECTHAMTRREINKAAREKAESDFLPALNRPRITNLAIKRIQKRARRKPDAGRGGLEYADDIKDEIEAINNDPDRFAVVTKRVHQVN